jgi:hypothetical protein
MASTDYEGLAEGVDVKAGGLQPATAYPTPESKAPVQQSYKRGLADYLKMFDDFRNTSTENRRQQAIDLDYYDGKQLTLGEKRVLSSRGQPDIVINRVRTAVNGILGVIIHSKADPRCFPRTPKDENSADVATDTLRYIAHRNRWNRTKAECFYEMLVPGIGASIIQVNEDNDVEVVQIRQEEFFWDPRSRRRDFKDAAYLGIAKWMYSTDVERMYPGQQISLSYSSMEGLGGAVDSTFEDRPRNQGAWLDIRNRRVMLVELYHLYDGKWYKCCFYGGGILAEEVSPFKDDKGRPCCPIEAMTAYIDQDNNRYGIVRDMRDIQDEINKRRSKLLHLVSSHQIQARDPSAIEVDADTARKEAARPDGVIPYGWEVVRTTDMSAGQMQLLAEAKNEMERMGPNPAVLGRQGADTSGRALLARQQAGLVELALVIDQLDDWELRVYHQCWWRAQQYWKDPQWIRVTDNADDPQFVMINKPRGAPILHPTHDETGASNPAAGTPMTYPDQGDDGEDHPMAGKPMQGPPQFHPPVYPDDHPNAGEPHPKANESVFGYDNEIGEMDIDIIVDTQPETANIMQEMLQDLIKLVSASPAYAEQVPFELFLELSPLPRKRQVMDMLKQYQAGKAAQQSKQQAIQMQAQMDKLAAEVDLLKAKAAGTIMQGAAALAKSGAETAAAETAADEAATHAVATMHDAITDHATVQQNQQELDQQAQQPDGAAEGEPEDA